MKFNLKEIIRKVVRETDDIDPIASARTKGRDSYSNSGEQLADAIEYAGGQAMWNKLSKQEQEDCLDFVSKGRDRSQQFGENSTKKGFRRKVVKEEQSTKIPNKELIQIVKTLRLDGWFDLDDAKQASQFIKGKELTMQEFLDFCESDLGIRTQRSQDKIMDVIYAIAGLV